MLELISMLKEIFEVEEKQNKQCVLTSKRTFASNDTSLMTTREAASVEANEIKFPPQNKDSHIVSETLDFQEKKILLEEKEMQTVTQKKLRLQRNSETANVRNGLNKTTTES